ncbi:UDP-N-acetylmuramate dehydrogenase [Crocinitomicaceae bacterium]|nr:UDP-N-acetylmuramate dehydrogenase [Crocinitomicaceae bacterium]
MIQSNVDLQPYNTFGLSSIAKRFAAFRNAEELTDILSQRGNDPLLILGGGSNILLTKDFEGLVIKNEVMGFQVIENDDTSVLIESGAGEVWHEFVMHCINEGYGGIENLSLIPGSVGASPMQNIGAYGVEIKDTFDSLQAYHIESGEVHSFNHEQCEFGYRESVFKRALKGQYIILSVRFRLSKKHKLNTSYGAIETELKSLGIKNPSIKDVSTAVINIRSSKLPDPKKIGNAGSFFKNPVVAKEAAEAIAENYEQFPQYPAPNGKIKLAAGWLIEQAGWKGKDFGSYGVHKNQALVLVNYGGSKGSEIYDLSEQIIQDVESKFGIRLEREVNMI